MTQEELKEYKKKISNLTVNEQKMRDLHLRDLSLGLVEGPLTGYASIDKPWLQYYKENYYPTDGYIKTVYEELTDNNQDNKKALALEYFGSKINFGKLLEKVDKAAAAFKKLGVKEGDYVTVICAGIPELVYSFYGLSKIGAVSNMMAYYFDKEDMKRRIKDCNSKVLVIMDSFYDELKDTIKETDIEKIIIVPTLNSSILRFLSKKYKVKDKKEMLWNDFEKGGKGIEVPIAKNYKNMPLTMVYSSGTTGASKGILLSNDSFQHSVFSYRLSGVDIGRGFKFYQIIPPWYSTGISTSINLPLVSGSAVFMDPRFERDIFIKNIIKHKPNYSVAPTSMYEGFLDDKLVGNADLSFFKYPFEGGEPLRVEVSSKIEEVFKNHNSDSKLLVGYGQCECGATITTETVNTSHVDGNVGIPLPGINLSIINDFGEEVPYGNRGEIYVSTPCGMTEYYKNPTATSEYFYNENNVVWSRTGDIGHMDSLGNLFIDGRASDYSTVNNKRIYNFDVENVIIKDENVKLCEVITNNNQLTAHIVFNDTFKNNTSDDEKIEELRSIQEKIYNELSDEDFVPSLFKIRDSFPYAKSGKRDIQKLQKETNGFIELAYHHKGNVKVKEK